MASDIYVSFGGDTASLEASLASAKTAVSNLARELAALSREQAATGASADSEIGQKMLAVAAQLTAAKSAVTGLKGELSTVGEAAGGAGGIAGLLAPVTAFRESMSGLVELFAATFAVDKIGEFISSMGELGEQTERTAMILGLTTEQVGEMQYAFAATGTSAENIDQMMGRFEVSLAKAVTGTGPAVAGLKALGLSASELIKLPLPEQMDRIADAVSRFADGPAKTAAVQSLGRGFVELIPLLDKGAAGFEELRAKADATNSTLDETATAKLVAMQHALVDLRAAIEGDAIQAFQPFASIVTAVSDNLSMLAEAMSTSVKSSGLLGAAYEQVATVLMGLVTVLGAGVTLFVEIGDTGDMVFKAMGDAGVGFGKVIGDVVAMMAGSWKGFWSSVVEAGKSAMLDVAAAAENMAAGVGFALRGDLANAQRAFGGIAGNASDAVASIEGAFGGLKLDWSKTDSDAAAAANKVAADFRAGGARMVADGERAMTELKTLWGGASGAAETSKTPSKPQTPALDEATAARDKAAREAARLAEAEAGTEIDAAKRAATGVERSLDEQLKTHQITNEQWLAGTIAALDSEAAAVKASYDKELQSASLTSSQIVTIKRQEAATLGEIAQKVRDAEAKAAEQSAQQWKSEADQVAQAMNSQVDGLLRGTTTISQAFKNMAASMIEDAIKWSIKAIAEQGAVVAAHVTGATTIAAADQSANAAGALSWIGSALHAIEAAAAQTFAGVTAFMAPTVGPAAPAFGAAAMASVTAVEGILYDTGVMSVPRDMVAGVHAGEVIIPQRGGLADEFRAIVANGGFAASAAESNGGAPAARPVSVTAAPQFHIHSMDSATVAATFNANRGEIMKAMSKAVRDGAHHGLRFT